MKSKHEQPGQPSFFAWFATAVFFIVNAMNGWFFADEPRLLAIGVVSSIFIFIAVVVLVSLPRALWNVLFDALKNRRLPMIALHKSDGTGRSKCPFCGHPVTLSEVAAGTPAFTCNACGKQGNWTTDS